MLDSKEVLSALLLEARALGVDAALFRSVAPQAAAGRVREEVDLALSLSSQGRRRRMPPQSAEKTTAAASAISKTIRIACSTALAIWDSAMVRRRQSRLPHRDSGSHAGTLCAGRNPGPRPGHAVLSTPGRPLGPERDRPNRSASSPNRPDCERPALKKPGRRFASGALGSIQLEPKTPFRCCSTYKPRLGGRQ